MSQLDWIRAASLAMPGRAQLSHITRIQALGLDFGPMRPFHFTVAGDLHLDVDQVFLHRTEVLPPCDEVGVSPASAFIQVCASMRMIDAIKVGDWLLHRRHMTVLEVAELIRHQRWRPGAAQARQVLQHLDGGARSIKESEVRALFVFAGLPSPEVNADIFESDERLGCVDLLYRAWRLAVEYEGRQHAESSEQFRIDIARYARFREAGVEYVQVTNEMLGQPRALATLIHRKLRERGYDGPHPVFGRRWNDLFGTITVRSVKR
ncbi:hypothetical protein GCM10022234_09710 [Aeromicrobium panaciterrae]|uniref:hypothetical protein n=1 Tax=Aeromicrobium panaciterrae TaxID=363861 RepID=UPI0031E1C42D